MSLFKRKKSKAKGLLCLSFSADGIALSVTPDPSQTAAISRVDFLSAKKENQIETLKRYLEKQGLQTIDCAVVLQPADYRLVQVDAPDVDEATLSSSALWLAKDLIDMPIAEAAVDAFYVPVRKGQPAKAQAIVAKMPALIQLRDSLSALGLNLMTIDIEELALRNLLYRKEEQQRGAGLIYFDNDHLQLMIMQSGLVSLVRRLNTVVSSSNEEEVKSQLVLEIQRSLDFYQTQQGRPAPQQLYLMPGVLQQLPWLGDELKGQLALKADKLLLDELSLEPPLSDELKNRCMAVIGETQREQFELSQSQEEAE